MTTSKVSLLDTNVLVYAADTTSPFHPAAKGLRYKVRKQEIFDLQLVATMLSNNISRIYTYDQEHFSKF